jgi:hypothetical protein
MRAFQPVGIRSTALPGTWSFRKMRFKQKGFYSCHPESLAIQGFVHPVGVARATRRERALRKRRSPHHTLVEKVANDSGCHSKNGLTEDI